MLDFDGFLLEKKQIANSISLYAEFESPKYYLLLRNIHKEHLHIERFKKYGKVETPRLLLVKDVPTDINIEEEGVKASIKKAFKFEPIKFRELSFTDEKTHEALQFSIKSASISRAMEAVSGIIGGKANKQDLYMIDVAYVKPGYGKKYKGENKYAFTISASDMRLYLYNPLTKEKKYLDPEIQ